MPLEHIVRKPTGTIKATPVLFLHGAWHGAWCYDLWLDDFAANGYEAHAMSLPGHGASGTDKPYHLYSMVDYAAALKTVVDEITPKPFVVAHSMGGSVLQEYLKHNHDLPGAVLLATVPVFGSGPFFMRYMIRHPLRFLLAGLTARFDRMMNTPELVREYFITPGAAMTAEELAPRMVGEPYRVALEQFFTWRGRPRMVTTPLLVVAAERDAIFPLREEERTAADYGAKKVLINNQGHNLMIESGWRQTAAKIREWFDAIERQKQATA